MLASSAQPHVHETISLAVGARFTYSCCRRRCIQGTAVLEPLVSHQIPNQVKGHVNTSQASAYLKLRRAVCVCHRNADSGPVSCDERTGESCHQKTTTCLANTRTHWNRSCNALRRHTVFERSTFVHRKVKWPPRRQCS